MSTNLLRLWKNFHESLQFFSSKIIIITSQDHLHDVFIGTKNKLIGGIPNTTHGAQITPLPLILDFTPRRVRKDIFRAPQV